jgi:hypothetical protein
MSERPTFEEVVKAEQKIRGFLNMGNAVKKFDEGKPDMSYLLEFPVFLDFCRVMTLGEKKYGRDNYQLYDDVIRIEAAMMRHLSAWHNGEKIDPESGVTHLAHIIANAAILSTISTEKR